MKLGQLEIDLMANVARLQADMAVVRRDVGDTMSYVKRSADTAVGALGALGVGLSVAGFAAWMKSAVNAADKLDEMSDRTGVAASELSRMSLAYQLAGLSQETMGTSLAKLAKQAAEGNAAFKRLRVETRNTDDTVRSSTDLLGDLADAFQGVSGDAEKSALAQEIFGKSGAEMLPLLNGGRDGLKEMADMAERLGLVVSDDTAKAAGQFNDSLDMLGLGLQGVARQTMAQLLPTLNSLAGTFLTNVTQGGSLTKMADALAAGLKGLYSVGVGIVQVFSSVGTSLGAAGAALAAIMRGDFDAVRQINAEAQRDLRAGWAGAWQQIEDVWTGANGQAMDAASKAAGAQRALTLATKDQEEAAKRAAAEAKKLAEEQAKLAKAGTDHLAGLQRKNAAAQQELDLGRSLTAAEKEALDLEAKLADGKMTLTAAQRKQADADIARAQALADEKRWLDDTRKSNADALGTLVKTTAALEADVEKQREANAVLGLSADQIDLRSAAGLRDTAVLREQQAATMELVDWTGAMSAELRAQAAALRDRAQLLEDGVATKEAQAAAAAWKQTTDQIESGLTDSLMRAFEAGKGFGAALKDTLVNAFKTMVLKPIIQPMVSAAGSLVSNVGGSILGSLGMSVAGSAAASTGTAALGAAGIGATLGSFGATGLMSTLTGTGLGTTLGAAGSLISGGSIAGGIGMGLGAVAPYLVAAYAAYKLLGMDKGGTPHVGAMMTMDQYGNAGKVAGQDKYTKAETWTAVSALGSASLDAINGVSKAFGGAGGYTGRFGFKADGEDAAYGYLAILNAAGKSVAGWSGGSNWSQQMRDYQKDANKSLESYTADVATAVRGTLRQMDLPAWADNILTAIGQSASLDQVTAAAQQILSIKAALGSMSTSFSGLGGVFARIAGQSSDAQYQLAQFSGGIDALISNAQSFAQTYYTSGEQQGIQAASLMAQFKSLGLGSNLPQTLGEFRALVESQNVSTEAGRINLAALLEMSSQFASVAGYLADQGLTLEQLAGMAPGGAVFDEMTAAQQRQADLAAQQAELAARQASAAEATVASITSLGDLLGGKLDALNATITTKLDALRSDMQEANA